MNERLLFLLVLLLIVPGRPATLAQVPGRPSRRRLPASLPGRPRRAPPPALATTGRCLTPARAASPDA
jgi:hypothetical protein